MCYLYSSRSDSYQEKWWGSMKTPSLKISREWTGFLTKPSAASTVWGQNLLPSGGYSEWHPPAPVLTAGERRLHPSQGKTAKPCNQDNPKSGTNIAGEKKNTTTRDREEGKSTENKSISRGEHFGLLLFLGKQLPCHETSRRSSPAHSAGNQSNRPAETAQLR